MRKRYPNTVFNFTLVVLFGAVIGLVALWHPFIYILVGCMVIAFLALGIRDDRKRKRER